MDNEGRAETITRVIRIQKNHRGKLCASKNRLVHFTRDALNFRPPKIYAAPPSSVQVSLSSLRRVTLRSKFRSINVRSAPLPLMLTRKAESAQITHRQEISM